MATSIWPKSSKARVDRSLSAHSVMGLVISALMFIVCLSGTVAMFEDEIGWWENPVQAPVEAVGPDVAQAAAVNVFEAQPETTHLYLYLPRDNWQRFVIGGDDGLQSADAQGAMTGGYETAWNDFLIHLHYYLSLPTSFGMIVVAILGVMLVAMAVSGLLAHPRIFRDAFRLRTKGQARLVQADLHNRLSVWTAPFTIAIALTGAMIGLFVVVAVVLAQTSFDGDPRALSESIFGAEGEIDESPAPLADVGAALVTLGDIEPDANPFLVIVHDPGTASQHTTIYGEHTDRLVYGEMYEFDADGAYEGKAGYTDGEAGKQIAMSTYRLHFGDFGGLAMKVAYFVMGVGLCIVVAAGLNIYFLKRAEAGRGMPRLEAAWAALVWGSPALLAATLAVSLLGVGMVSLTALFWLGALALCGLGLVLRDHVKTARRMRLCFGVSLLAAVGVHAVRFADSYQWLHISGVSACFVVLGFFLVARTLSFGRSSQVAAEPSAAPMTSARR